MKSQSALQKVCQVGLLAAMVFVTSGIRIVIPISAGNTAIHLGNILCLLAGLLLGPLQGGLAAGIGSALFDLANPLYVASAPFTLLFKFCIGALAGHFAYAKDRKGTNHRWNLIGSVLGSLTYTVLYVAKSFVSNLLVKGLQPGPAVVAVLPNLAASVTNGMIAVLLAVPLAAAISAALRKAGLARA